MSGGIPDVNLPIRVDHQAVAAQLKAMEAEALRTFGRIAQASRGAFAGGGTDALMGGNPGQAAPIKALFDIQAKSEAAGRGLENLARIGARAGVAISRGIGAATAATAAAERSWIGLGTTLLTSFAAGGPIGLGIAAVGTAVGLLAGHSKEAGEAAEKARVAYAAWLDIVGTKAKEAKEKIADLGDETLAAERKLAGGEADVAIIRAERRAREAAEALRQDYARSSKTVFRDGKDQPFSFDDFLADQRRMPYGFTTTFGGQGAETKNELEKERAKRVMELVDAEKALAALRTKQGAVAAVDAKEREDDLAKAHQRVNDELAQKLRLLHAETDLDRTLLNLEQERQAAIDGGGNRRLANSAFKAARDDAVSKFLMIDSDSVAKEQAAALDEWRKHVQDLEEEYADLVRWLDRVEGEEAAANAEEQAKARDKMTREVVKEVTAMRELAKWQRETTQDIDDQIALLEQTNDAARERLRIEMEIRDLRKGFTDRGVAAPEDKLQRLLGLKVAELERSLAPVQETLQDLFKSLSPTISSSLADAIMDGFKTGFSNGTSIAQQLVDTMLRQLLNQTLSSGLNLLFSGIFGGAGGTMTGGGGFGLGTVLQTVAGVATGAAGGGNYAPAGGGGAGILDTGFK